jgi:hypothetical protein
MAGRLVGKAKQTDWRGRATQAARTLRDEYEAGRRGDDAPAQPLWASPREQLDAVLGLVRGARDAGEPAPVASDAEAAAEADEVAAALRQVDWARVRATTAERSGDAARTVRSMAEQVDWAKVQPVAAQVSTALITAVASGQLGVGGRLGSMVARAIVDQGGLGRQVASRMAGTELAVPHELRTVIDATAREA